MVAPKLDFLGLEIWTPMTSLKVIVFIHQKIAYNFYIKFI